MSIEKNSKFRPWVQKVMPTVFDDSLTYYELLSKVIGYLNQLNDQANEIIDFMDQSVKDQNQNITDLQVAFVSFRDELNKLYDDFKFDVENTLLPQNLDSILSAWYDNGKLANIINNDVFSMKVDKTTYDEKMTSIDTQLAKTNQNILNGNLVNFFEKDYKGVNMYTPYNSGKFGSYQSIIDKLVEVGCNSIAICPLLSMASETSNTLNRTALDSEVLGMFQYAKSKGLKTMLKCHVSGIKNPSTVRTWIQSLIDNNLYYVNLVKDYIDMICLANELTGQTNANYDLWLTFNNNVKNIKNIITTTSPTVWELSTTVLFDIVDVIGCNLYVAVGGSANSTVDDLKKNMFNDVRNYDWITTLNNYVKKYKKPLFITEVGILPTEENLIDPANWQSDGWVLNEDIQVLYYTVAIPTLLNSVNIKGIFLWGVSDDFTFIGRKAENTVKELFGGVSV